MKVQLLLVSSVAVSLAFADDLTLTTGKVLKNYKISRVEPDGIVINHSSGISKIPLSEMPDSYRNSVAQTTNESANSGSIASESFSPSEMNYTRQRTQDGTTLATTRLANGATLSVEYGGDIVYGTVPDKDSYQTGDIYIDDSYHILRLRGDKVVGNKLVQIRGLQFRAAYQSLTPHLADISEGGLISWKSPGQAMFRISASSMDGASVLGSIVIQVKVVRLPLTTRMASDKVVEVLGFPDSRTEKYFEWHDKSGWFEGIWYSFKTDGRGETIQHYSYAKYPGLKIRINTYSKTLAEVNTLGWDQGYAIGID